MIQAVRYSLSGIRAEVRYLVEVGRLRRTQPVSALSGFFLSSEWRAIEAELELADVQLHDQISDLTGPEDWPND